MRLLVFLLIFANLLFFAYSRGYFGEEISPDAQRIQKQLNPERLHVLERTGELVADVAPLSTSSVLPPQASPDVEPAAPQPAESAAPENVRQIPPPPLALLEPEQDVCAFFSTTEPGVASQIAEQANIAGLRVSQRAEGGWWVFIPPLANRQMAVEKTGELLALGISEFFIMPDGPQQFAISLGVFSQEEAARTYLGKLREKGVRSARVSARNAGAVRQQLEVRGDAIALLSLRANLPDGVSSRDCR
ncbi:MAG: hypothetical protein LBO79_10045 [Zoogloeaceae bacterium]|jgi:hypothetical protein|nr:hypothetical protein [Zoogloeaceae bacterium]